MEQELPSLLQSYELWGKQPFISDFSRLSWHAIEKGEGPILYSKKITRTHGEPGMKLFAHGKLSSSQSTLSINGSILFDIMLVEVPYKDELTLSQTTNFRLFQIELRQKDYSKTLILRISANRQI